MEEFKMYKSELELLDLQEDYQLGILKLTNKERLQINPKVAYEVTDEDVRDSIPQKEVDKVKDKYGALSRFSYHTPVKNLLWDYLHFVNSNYFRPAALIFEESLKAVHGTALQPSYCRAIPGTNTHSAFWEEEYKRIVYGYEPIIDGQPCGIKIPGEFYFYLNYGWIKQAEFDKVTGKVLRDISGFPLFLAMDYYYFRELDARENPERYGLPSEYKQSLIVAKGRRLGFSYKAAAGCVWKCAFGLKNKTSIASIEGVDAARCFHKCIDMIDHLTNYTPFGLEDIGHAAQNGGWIHAKRSVKPASGYFSFTIKNTRNGERIGRQSTIETVSLHNRPDAISGEGLSRLYFEEAGKIDNLSSAWTFSLESMRVGEFYRSGIAIVFGTGGEMVSSSGKKGSSQDFRNFFYKPASSGFAEFNNIYDYKTGNDAKCGYFVASMWFRPANPVILDSGAYRTFDDQGNAFFWVAELAINAERYTKMPPNKPKKDYEDFLTQICKTPSEAFYVTQGSRFQTSDLIARQNEIMMLKGGFDGLRMCGELIEINGLVDFVPKPDAEPITTSNVDLSLQEGCLVQYEPPMTLPGTEIIPEGEYIISVDPIGISTGSGQSLIAIIVFKTGKHIQLGEEKIVATYYGRKKVNPIEHMQQLLLKLSKYYNAQISYENDRDGGIPEYFLRRGELSRLMLYPELMMSKLIINSKTSARPYGHSMSSLRHKQIGESLIYEWLDKRAGDNTYFDSETGEKMIVGGVRNIDRLCDQLLIEQLINYSSEGNGNYDAVSALMGCLIQMKEAYDKYELESQSEYSPTDDLDDYYESVYGNQYK